LRRRSASSGLRSCFSSGRKPMTSSTFNSEGELDAKWRRWLMTCLATLAVSYAALFAAVVTLDPFSTGRLTPIERIDIAVPTRPYAAVGLARDPRFDAAIIGNSRALRIDPAVLTAATGTRFMQLAVYNVAPPDSLILMDAFRRSHRGPGGVFVLVLDWLWCDAKRGRGFGSELPRWLYQGSDLDYLRRLPSPLAVIGAARRALILAGLAGPAVRADGFDPDGWNPPNRAQMRQDMESLRSPTEAPEIGEPFPYLDDLAAQVTKLDTDAAVVLVFPPIYVGLLPAPNSNAEAKIGECKDRLRQIARSRPGTALVDLEVDSPLARDAGNFIDATHLADNAVGELDSAIVRAVRDLTRR
jgi:hypothetical protein